MSCPPLSSDRTCLEPSVSASSNPSHPSHPSEFLFLSQQALRYIKPPTPPEGQPPSIFPPPSEAPPVSLFIPYNLPYEQLQASAHPAWDSFTLSVFSPFSTTLGLPQIRRCTSFSCPLTTQAPRTTHPRDNTSLWAILFHILVVSRRELLPLPPNQVDHLLPNLQARAAWSNAVEQNTLLSFLLIGHFGGLANIVSQAPSHRPPTNEEVDRNT